jgi:hypothetical protein
MGQGLAPRSSRSAERKSITVGPGIELENRSDSEISLSDHSSLIMTTHCQNQCCCGMHVCFLTANLSRVGAIDLQVMTPKPRDKHAGYRANRPAAQEN